MGTFKITKKQQSLFNNQKEQPLIMYTSPKDPNKKNFGYASLGRANPNITQALRPLYKRGMIKVTGFASVFHGNLQIRVVDQFEIELVGDICQNS